MEYAAKAVENSGTVIGLRGKDGVVFGVEKLVTSKLYEPGANKRIFHVDEHVGMVSLSVFTEYILINIFLEFSLANHIKPFYECLVNIVCA